MANKAYIRVSTVDQNHARQKEILAPYDIEIIYEEKLSGKNMVRPKLIEMVRNLVKGDTVYVVDFSRLARNTKDLLTIMELIESKGASLVSLKENIDTSTPAGRLMLHVIAAINQFERDNIKERQAEGIAIAKREGKYKGRKPIEKPNNFDEVYARWSQRQITGKKAMEELKLSRSTFYNMVKRHEEDLRLQVPIEDQAMEHQTSFEDFAQSIM